MNKEKITIQKQIENIDEMVFQNLGLISDTIKKIIGYLEQRKKLIEQLKNEN